MNMEPGTYCLAPVDFCKYVHQLSLEKGLRPQTWSMVRINDEDRAIGIWMNNSGDIGWMSTGAITNGAAKKQIKPSEMLAYIESYVKPIIIGNYQVKVKDDGSIIVGCVDVSFEMIEKIYKEAKSKRNK